MLTQAILKELLHYNAETGVFTWLKHRKSTKKGAVAGYLRKNGYILIGIFGKLCPAHRLAWLYVHGEIPSKFIDHKDCNPSNNAIGNLRLATNSENQFNTKLRKDNTSGFKGVKRNGSGFQASAKIGKFCHCLGTYKTAEEASSAYQAFAKEKHREFYRE
jgi:HNH endonuclease